MECPREEATIALDACLVCAWCSGLRQHEGRGSVVVCGTGEPAAPSALPTHYRAGQTDPTTVTPVGDAMTRAVICVEADVATQTLVELLLREHVSAAIVVDRDSKPLGVVSTTDLLRVASESAGVASAVAALARDVMTPAPLAVFETDTIAQASALMAFEGVHRVVVVGNDRRVVGVLSSIDVLRWIGQRAGFLIPDLTHRQRRQA